jgi:hypothetical protein
VRVALFRGARTDDYWTAGVAFVWVLSVAIGTIRALRILSTIAPTTDRATRLAFELAVVLPIAGITPVVLLLLPPGTLR